MLALQAGNGRQAARATGDIGVGACKEGWGCAASTWVPTSTCEGRCQWVSLLFVPSVLCRVAPRGLERCGHWNWRRREASM